MNKKLNKEEIIIRRPKEDDINALHHFIRVVIVDTSVRNKIADFKEDL